MNTPYNHTFFTQAELEGLLRDRVDPVELTRVISAYELAESVHESQVRLDESPYFFHSTRVCKIVLKELHIDDPDVLCAALLHDVLEDSDTITRSVLEFNFGEYVAYIVETLTKDFVQHRLDPDQTDADHVNLLKHSSEDCLLIKLAVRLDNFRCLQFDLKRNPMKYITNTLNSYVPLAKDSSNEALQKLTAALQQESNKFLG